MPKSITLEEVVNLAKQLSPLDRIRLIEQITPHIKRDLIVSPSQPHNSLQDLWKKIDISEADIAEIKSKISEDNSHENI